MVSNDNIFNQFFGGITGKDGKEYRCVECKYPMERITVQTMLGDPRKLFYCKRKECSRFGTVTVIAK